ncbi:MAG: helix-turn-helix domain-containing protein [Acidobacteriota bacterium]
MARKKKSGDTAIARRIGAAMATRALTMRELSERAGVPYGSLQNYLLEKNNVPAPTIGKIAEALGVSTDWLILGKPSAFDRVLFVELLPLISSLLQEAKGKLSEEEIAQIFLDEYTRRHLRNYSEPPLHWHILERVRNDRHE